METLTAVLVVGGAALAVLLFIVVLVALSLRRRSNAHAELAGRVDAARDEIDGLRQELDQLVRERRPETRDLVITDAPLRSLDDGARDGIVDARPVGDQVVLSATLGEPLVRAAALGHGVRRALSAESRNRILFEMKREVRRSRRQRRKDMKTAYRQMQGDRTDYGTGEFQ